MRGGRPSKSRTTKATCHDASMKGSVYFVSISPSAKTIFRLTMSRWLSPGSGFILVSLVEGVEAALVHRTSAGTRELRGLLEQMLHGMTRLRLIQEERDLALVQSELGRQRDPKVLVPREQGSADWQQFVQDESLRGMEVDREL